MVIEALMNMLDILVFLSFHLQIEECMFLLVGTRDGRTQSARVQPAHAQSVPSPARDCA